MRSFPLYPVPLAKHALFRSFAGACSFRSLTCLSHRVDRVRIEEATFFPVLSPRRAIGLALSRDCKTAKSYLDGDFLRVSFVGPLVVFRVV